MNKRIFFILISFLLIGAASYKMVVGPTSSTDGNVALWNGTGGYIVKDSSVSGTNIGLLDADQTFGGNNTYSNGTHITNITFSDSSAARTAVGIAIGSDVQAHSATLVTLAEKDGSILTILDGSGLTAATVNSNAFDTATLSSTENIDTTGGFEGDGLFWSKGGSWDVFNPNEYVKFSCEYIFQGSIYDEATWDGTVSGGGTTLPITSDSSGTIGMGYFIAGSSSTAAWTLRGLNDDGLYADSAHTFLTGGKVRIWRLSNDTEPYYIEHGFNRKVTSATPNDSIALQVHTNVFSLVTRSNSVETLGDSAYTVETNIWYDWKIVADLSVPSAILYVGTNETQMNSNPVRTNTLNLPIGRTFNMQWFIQKINVASNTNTIISYIDKVWIQIYRK